MIACNWVLLPLSFKGRRGDAEHKGVWNPELPLSPVLLAVPCRHQSLGPRTPAPCAGVGEAEGILPALFTVAHAGVTAHYIQPIT